MQALEERDYFTDHDILKDPYAFFEAVRAHGPIYQPPGRDYLVVTGFAETLEILKNSEDFSAIIGLQGQRLPSRSPRKARTSPPRSRPIVTSFWVAICS
jgi:cytochrome P450